VTETLIAAGTHLAETLTQENLALDALDLQGAASLLAEKTRAIDAFLAAQALAAAAGPISADLRRTAETLAARLASLAAENRRLLERGIAVQGRVIGLIARATPRGAEHDAPGYKSDGGLTGPARPMSIAVSSSV
jgi:hypothetical protein